MKRRRILVGILLALMLTIMPAIPALAAPGTTQDVIVTATPAFISIELDVTTWAPNDIVGDGVTPKGFIAPDTVYYSNPIGDATIPSDPVVDGECRFTIDNVSTIPIDLTVNFPDFTGGDAMTNTDTDGSNGVGAFGAFAYASGMTTYASDKVVAKTTGSVVMEASLTADTDIKWGLEIETQSDAWTSGDAMTSTVVISAVAS